MQEERRRSMWEAPHVPARGKRRWMVDSSCGTAGETRTQNTAGTSARWSNTCQAGGGVRSQGQPTVCGWGVVASVVFRGGESPLQGEGLDGSTITLIFTWAR